LSWGVRHRSGTPAARRGRGAARLFVEHLGDVRAALSEKEESGPSAGIGPWAQLSAGRPPARLELLAEGDKPDFNRLL
jgi:hypothetical protein